MEAPLLELSRLSKTEFPNLSRARTGSRAKLSERRRALAALVPDENATVVFVGSIGRLEATEGSDDDFMLLIDQPKDETGPVLGIDQVKVALTEALSDFKAPGTQDIFGQPVLLRDLAQNIGLTADDNSNTTRRMLFLLESEWAFGEECYERSFDRILDRYLETSVKDWHPPRFILNDVVRYWRTMCVDFAGKAMQGPEKWGLRNAKLGTSRKILFAGGLLPILDCHRLDEAGIRRFLREQFKLCPTDRIANSFLLNETIEEGAWALKAYDDFVGLLADPDKREALARMDREEALKSEFFLEIKRIGDRIQDGLLALLLDSEGLAQTTRKYAIF